MWANVTMHCLFTALAVLLSLAPLGCVVSAPPSDVVPKEVPEQDLQITFGGWVQGGPEDQLLDGVCGTDQTRNVVNCDLHNGLMEWNITEVTFQVVPSRDEHQHYYRERVSIPPLQTEHVSIRLGMRLPADDHIKFKGRIGGQALSHWSWVIVGAKGKPAADHR